MEKSNNLTRYFYIRNSEISAVLHLVVPNFDPHLNLKYVRLNHGSSSFLDKGMYIQKKHPSELLKRAKSADAVVSLPVGLRCSARGLERSLPLLNTQGWFVATLASLSRYLTTTTKTR